MNTTREITGLSNHLRNQDGLRGWLGSQVKFSKPGGIGPTKPTSARKPPKLALPAPITAPQVTSPYLPPRQPQTATEGPRPTMSRRDQVETPNQAEARQAREDFAAGKVDLFNYLRAQETGFKATIGGETYLRSIDGVFRKTMLPRGLLEMSAQDYRNERQVNAYRQQLRNPHTRHMVDPVMAWPKSDGTYLVTDGHHRLWAADEEGITNIPVWVPTMPETPDDSTS